MATRTLTAMFDTYDGAAEAVRQLEAAGVPHADVSIVSNDASHAQYHDTAGDATTTGTGAGASLGTILGGGAGLLAGLGLLAIPGLGPVVAAGWLASTLLGAGVGAAAGGVVGALTGAGVSETDAHAYAEGLRRGGTLVTARVDDTLTERATDILDREGTVDMDQREGAWRGEGWSATAPAVDTGSLGYAAADRAFAGGAPSTGAGSTTGSTIAGAAAGAGAAATRVGGSIEDAAGRTLRGAENAAGRLGARIGADDLQPTGAANAPGPVFEGSKVTSRGRVRVYDVP